jgi:hypothetical protein
MNGDIHAARTLLSELRKAYKSLPRHLQLRITYLLRETAISGDTEMTTVRRDISRQASRPHSLSSTNRLIDLMTCGQQNARDY